MRIARDFSLLTTLFSAVLLSYCANAFERTDPNDVNGWSDDRKMAFVEKNLGPYKTALIEAAKRNRIPPRLLATVVINELSDYGMEDVLQEKVYSWKYTIGLGQTSVNLARSRNHFDGLISESEITARMSKLNGPVSSMWRSSADVREEAYNQLAWEKLMDPPAALEIAAREVSRIINKFNENINGPWAKHFLKKAIDRADPYPCMKPAEYSCKYDNTAAIELWEKKLAAQDDLDLAREISLTLAVEAAYNSGGIIDGNVEHSTVFALFDEKANFAQARRHALNATGMWSEVLFNRNYPEGNDPFEGKWEGRILLEQGSIAKAFHDLIPKMLQEFDDSGTRTLTEWDAQQSKDLAGISDPKQRQERQASNQKDRQNRVKEHAELKQKVLVPLFDFMDQYMFAGEMVAKTGGIWVGFDIRRNAQEKLEFGLNNISGFVISPVQYVEVEHPVKKSGGLARNTLKFVNNPANKDTEGYWDLLEKNPILLRLHRKDAENSEINTNADLKEYTFNKNDEPQLHFQLSWNFKRIGDVQPSKK